MHIHDPARLCLEEGNGDRYGVWLEGEIRQSDPQLCIWLTGIFVVQQRAKNDRQIPGG